MVNVSTNMQATTNEPTSPAVGAVASSDDATVRRVSIVRRGEHGYGVTLNDSHAGMFVSRISLVDTGDTAANTVCGLLPV